MKKLLSVIAALTLVATVGVTAAQAAEPYNFNNIDMAQDEAVMVISENGVIDSFNSKLTVQPPKSDSTDTRGEWLHCSGADDKTCDMTNPDLDLLGQLLLPHCSEATNEACIQSVSVAAPGGEFQEAKFLRSAKGGIRIAGNTKLGLLDGVTPSMFEVPNTANASDPSTYAVVIKATQHYSHQNKKYETTSLVANVLPYRQVAGSYKAARFDANAKPSERYKDDRVDPGCVWVEDGACGKLQDFVAGTRVKLAFKMPKSIGGWFSGRMKDPKISVTPASANTNLVVIDSEAVSVPQLAYVKKRADIIEEKTFNIGSGGTPKGIFWSVNSGGIASEDVFKFMELYRKPLNDTAAGVSTLWNMMTISGGGGSGCLGDTSKVLGIATTNAMAYDSTAPSFKNGFLSYQVAGLHYLPGGKEVAEGTYDLVMRSETARCLYGFSKAPVSATVSVLGGDSTSIATTVVNEKDGWLKMAAYGFTFSQKTLQVKVTQKGAVKKQTTITCVKGKTTKKVSGVSPKCPSGFKKK